MAHAGVPAAFQHVEEAVEVAGGVGSRVLQRVAHAGLGGEMDHQIETSGGEKRVHARRIGEVELVEGEARIREPGEAVMLQPRVVIGVQVVEPDHLPAFGEQTQRDGAADETGNAGDENAGHTAPGATRASARSACPCASWPPRASPRRWRTDVTISSGPPGHAPPRAHR